MKGIREKATEIASQTLKEWVDAGNDSVTGKKLLSFGAFLICIVFRARFLRFVGV